RAPKAGTVVNLSAGEGEMVGNEDPFTMIATMDTMKMEFSVTADEHKLLKQDDKRKVTLQDTTYDATISKVGSSPDDTGLYPVEATIDQEDVDILIGTVANIKIPVKRVKDAIIVPTETIVEKGGESFVFVIEDDQAVETKVTIEETQSDKTAIKGDGKKDDEIVTTGQLSLQDGSKVNVVEAGEYIVKLVKTSVKMHVVVIIIVLVIIALGIVSARNLVVDLFPKIAFPVAVVATTYEDAAPQEVENLISRPIESSISSVEGINTIQSQSQSGNSLVLMMFNNGV